MKKKLLILLSGLFALNAQANQTYCGYTDTFHISDTANSHIHIKKGSSDGSIEFKLIDKRTFELKDADQCKAGHVQIKIKGKDKSYCVISIFDGPYMVHPTAHPICKGLNFTGITYDGYKSYSYTLNFKDDEENGDEGKA
jgi:hypothetical protein